MSESFNVPIPLLTGEDNYQSWADTIELYFRLYDWEDYIEGLLLPPSKPALPVKTESAAVSSTNGPETKLPTAEDFAAYKFEKEEYETWKKKDTQLMLYIQTSLDAPLKATVKGTQSAREMWIALRDKLSTQGRNRAVEYIRELQRIRLRKFDDDASKYCVEFRVLRNGLVRTGLKFPSIFYVFCFLEGVGKDYEVWKEKKYAENSKLRPDEEPQSIDLLVAELLDQPRLPRTPKIPLPSRGDGNIRGRGRGHAGRNTSHPDHSLSDKPKCNYCLVPGHSEDVCFYLHPDKAFNGWKAPDYMLKRIADNKKKKTAEVRNGAGIPSSNQNARGTSFREAREVTPEATEVKSKHQPMARMVKKPQPFVKAEASLREPVTEHHHNSNSMNHNHDLSLLDNTWNWDSAPRQEVHGVQW